jgi:hypothetical protein
MEKVPLPPTKSSGALQSKKRLTRKPPKRFNVGASFFSGIHSGMLVSKENPESKSEIPPEEFLEGSRAKLLAFLLENNFVPKKSENQSKLFSIEFVPSPSYSVKLILDRSLGFLQIHERPLCWVHGTLLSGKQKKITGDPQRGIPESEKEFSDIRIKLTTRQPISKDSEFFKLLYPEGEISPISVTTAPGSSSVPPVIRFSDHLPKKIRKGIRFVRFYKYREEFIDSNTGLVARISSGFSYEGTNLSTCTPFLEMCLVADTARLQSWVKYQSDFGSILSFPIFWA